MGTIVMNAGGLAEEIGAAVSWERGQPLPIPDGFETVDVLFNIDRRFGKLEGPSFEVALGRAVRASCDTKKVSRSLKGKTGVGVLPIAVSDTAIKAEGRSISFHNGPRGIISEPPGHPMLPEVQEKYDTILAQIAPEDITAALTAFVKEAGGFPLHSGGGMYYLPPVEIAKWRMAKEALAAFGWKLYASPMSTNEDSMAMVVDYATKAMVERVAQINEDLHGDAAGKNKLERNAAITARRIELQDLKRQAAKYETILGASFERVKEAADAAATTGGAAAILAGLL